MKDKVGKCQERSDAGYSLRMCFHVHFTKIVRLDDAEETYVDTEVRKMDQCILQKKCEEKTCKRGSIIVDLNMKPDIVPANVKTLGAT